MKIPVFDVSPSKSQIVFQGDEIPFECKATLVDDSTRVVWFRSGKLVESNLTAGVTVSSKPQQDLVVNNLLLTSVGKNHFRLI